MPTSFEGNDDAHWRERSGTFDELYTAFSAVTAGFDSAS